MHSTGGIDGALSDTDGPSPPNVITVIGTPSLRIRSQYLNSKLAFLPTICYPYHMHFTTPINEWCSVSFCMECGYTAYYLNQLSHHPCPECGEKDWSTEFARFTQGRRIWYKPWARRAGCWEFKKAKLKFTVDI